MNIARIDERVLPVGRSANPTVVLTDGFCLGEQAGVED
jgi:hypothetical protein